MRIEANIAEVAARFGRFADRAGSAVRSAMEPKDWEDVAKLAAEKRLRVLAGESPEKQDLVAAFVETVLVTAFGSAAVRAESASTGLSGMMWSMKGGGAAGFGAALDVAGIVKGAQDKTLGELGEAAKLPGKRAAADLIYDWVSADPSEGGKRKESPTDDDAQGRRLSPEKLAKRIYEILFKRNDSSAHDALLPHIQAFAEGQRFALSQDETREWLLAVLDEWRRIVLEQLPQRVAERLRAEL